MPSPGRPLARILILVAALAGSGLIATTAAIHLHLWISGYRHVPRIGTLFMAQAVAGFVLAPAALSRHYATLLAGAVYMAASAGGLIISATVGFLGIHDGLNVPWATTSLVVELAGLVLLAGAGASVFLER